MTRKFGVELEHGNRNGPRRRDPYGNAIETASEFVARNLRDAGFEVAEGGLGLRDGHDYTRAYNVGIDGSGVEVRTRILQGREGFNELERVMGLLTDIGGFVGPSDGLHVHVGCEDFSRNDLSRLVHSWVLTRDLIGKLVDDGRNGSYWCANVWNRDNARQLAVRQVDVGRQSDLNVEHFNRGHVEFRLHEGTLEYEKAYHWLLFCQGLLNGVKRRKNPIGDPLACRDLPTLMKRLRLPKETSDHLIARAA
jgi:hypothetical protein